MKISDEIIAWRQNDFQTVAKIIITHNLRLYFAYQLTGVKTPSFESIRGLLQYDNPGTGGLKTFFVGYFNPPINFNDNFKYIILNETDYNTGIDNIKYKLVVKKEALYLQDNKNLDRIIMTKLDLALMYAQHSKLLSTR